MVTDTLSCKTADPLIKDVCLRMKVIIPLLEKIQEAQVDAMKEEHQKSDNTVGKVASFDYDSWVLLTLHRRVWVPYFGGTQKVLME